MSTLPEAAGACNRRAAAARGWGGSSPAARRTVGGAVAFSCAALLGIAAWMTPAEAGLGTHEQLNLPPCGWIAIMDTPCVTCGMTTAFSHAVRGDLLASFLTQPFGFLLALATAVALVIALHVSITGARVEGLLMRLWTPRAIWIIGAVALGSWLYKVLAHNGMM